MTDDEVLKAVADSPKPLPNFSRKRDGFNRSDVVEAMHRTFHMIGGVQRMALWANANPGEFYKLYGKLLPATTMNIGDNNKIVIYHAIPPTALDQHQVPALMIDQQGNEVLPAIGQIVPNGELEHEDISGEVYSERGAAEEER